MANKKLSDVERFNFSYSPEPMSGCWIWMLSLDKDGYAQMHIGSRTDGSRKTIHAYRFSYEMHNGEIPNGLQIDHKCRLRCCVNPKHLEALTSIENTFRGLGITASNFLKTKCSRGHDLLGENVYNYRGPNGRKWRGCKQCAKYTRSIRRER